MENDLGIIKVKVNRYRSVFDLGYSFFSVKKNGSVLYLPSLLYHPYLVSILSGMPSLCLFICNV